MVLFQAKLSRLDQEGNVTIDDELFQSLPSNVRGTCRREHVEQVASLILGEYMSLYEYGYRGKDLKGIDRSQLLKYTGGMKGLHSVIMNTSLWRYIVSSLVELRIVKSNTDGTIQWLGEVMD